MSLNWNAKESTLHRNEEAIASGGAPVEPVLDSVHQPGGIEGDESPYTDWGWAVLQGGVLTTMVTGTGRDGRIDDATIGRILTWWESVGGAPKRRESEDDEWRPPTWEEMVYVLRDVSTNAGVKSDGDFRRVIYSEVSGRALARAGAPDEVSA